MKNYEVFKTTNLDPESISKDWRDAFIESFVDVRNTCLKVNFSAADCLYVHTSVNCCGDLTPLMAYVSQFEHGGFWYSKDCGLHFTTSGSNSDKDATYNDALIFCANWKQLRGN